MKKMMQRMLAAILICGSSLILSCTADYGDNPIQPELEEYKGIPLVIFDTDIGSSTDDLFAMEMLYRYADQGRCKLLGIVVDRQGDDYPVLAAQPDHSVSIYQLDRHSPHQASLYELRLRHWTEDVGSVDRDSCC